MSLRERMAADGAEIVRAVETPNWGTVHVRRVNLGERDRWIAKARDKIGDEVDAPEYSSALSLALILCDEKGEREYDPTNLDDLRFLSKRSRDDGDIVISAVASPGNSAGAKS